MHSRSHGDMVFPDSGGATAHDVNHLTILNDLQTTPFMNDTFEWPQWPALEVENEVVINYFQSMVTLGDPLGVFLNNREAVLEILERFGEDLTAMQKAIKRGDGKFLFDTFTRTRAIRREVIELGEETRPSPDHTQAAPPKS